MLEVRLAVDASRGGRLVVQPRRRNLRAAVLAEAVDAAHDAIERHVDGRMPIRLACTEREGEIGIAGAGRPHVAGIVGIDRVARVGLTVCDALIRVGSVLLEDATKMLQAFLSHARRPSKRRTSERPLHTKLAYRAG